MTKQELEQLEVGTLIYNGRTVGEIRLDDGMKVIDILITIRDMSNDANDFNEKPEYWDVLE